MIFFIVKYETYNYIHRVHKMWNVIYRSLSVVKQSIYLKFIFHMPFLGNLYRTKKHTIFYRYHFFFRYFQASAIQCGNKWTTCKSTDSYLLEASTSHPKYRGMSTVFCSQLYLLSTREDTKVPCCFKVERKSFY